MNVLLGNSHWLGFLALAGLPVLLHLVARARPPVYEFASLRFLQEITRRTMRLKQPRDWLVLLLRTLAVFGLVAAFLQPKWFQAAGKPLAGTMTEKTVVLLIDRSASMAYAESGTSRLAKAADQARSILEAAGGLTLANVVWIDRLPEAVYPEPGPNRDYLIDQVQRQQAVPEPAAIEAAWNLALTQFEDRGQSAAELFILSDFQGNAWKQASLNTPGDIAIYPIALTDDSPTNVAVIDLGTAPAQPLVGQSFDVHCRVANYSPTPRRQTVFLQVGQQRQSTTIDLTPWGETETVLSFQGPGTATFLPIAARLDEDGFPGDDLRHGVAAVRAALRVALVLPPGDAPGAETVRQLDRAFSWVSVSETKSLPEAAAIAPDVMLVLPGVEMDSDILREFASNGITVWHWAAASAGQPMERLEAGWKLALTQPEEAWLTLFAQGEYGNPFDGRVWERVRLKDINGQVIARFEDGAPALISDDAGFYQCAIPLDRERSSWSVQSAFVTLWGEIFRTSLRQNSQHEQEVLTGMPITWPPPPEIDPASVQLLDAQDRAQAVEAVTTVEGPSLISVGPAMPGPYRWTLSGTIIGRHVANFPAEESDLRSHFDDTPFAAQAGESGVNALAAAARRDGRPIWPWCLAVAILCLLLESLVLAWPRKPLKTATAIT